MPCGPKGALGVTSTLVVPGSIVLCNCLNTALLFLASPSALS